MKIVVSESPLSTKEQLLVLLVSSVAGFAATKFTETRVTNLLLRNKS